VRSRRPDGRVTDRELLARLSQDPDAFEAFYQRHVDRIIGFAVRRCVRPEDVADLVAAVFLAVIESAPRYDPTRGEPLGWLFAIAANQLRAQRRRDGREQAIARRVSGQRLLTDDEIGQLEARIDAERLAPELREAIARVPAAEREAFELIVGDGLSAAQAAEALGISAVAARVRLSRARGRLRAALASPPAEQPPDPERPRASRVGALTPTDPTTEVSA